MARFTVTCNQCGQQQEFSSEDPMYNEIYNNKYYFEKGKKISITANPFSDPPEIEIECQNPDCKSEI